MSILFNILPFIYLFFILYILYGLQCSKNKSQLLPIYDLDDPDQNQNEKDAQNFSIIVCSNKSSVDLVLNKLAEIKAPVFELIVVDDRSNPCITINKENYDFEITVIRIDEIPENTSAKKNGVNLAVKAAKYQKVITVDDDTIIDADYINEVYSLDVTDTNYIVGLIKPYSVKDNWFSKIAKLDFIGFNLISVGLVNRNLPIYSNANNQVFNRDTFLELDPYADNMDILSGDDTFLLTKMAVANKKFSSYYSTKFTTSTDVPYGIKDFINQRIRWVSKSHKIEDKRVFAISILLYLFNLIIAVSFVLSPMYFLYYLLIKTFADYLLLNKTLKDFNETSLIKNILFTEIFQVMYILVLPILGITKGNKKW